MTDGRGGRRGGGVSDPRLQLIAEHLELADALRGEGAHVEADAITVAADDLAHELVAQLSPEDLRELLGAPPPPAAWPGGAYRPPPPPSLPLVGRPVSGPRTPVWPPRRAQAPAGSGDEPARVPVSPWARTVGVHASGVHADGSPMGLDLDAGPGPVGSAAAVAPTAFGPGFRFSDTHRARASDFGASGSAVERRPWRRDDDRERGHDGEGSYLDEEHGHVERELSPRASFDLRPGRGSFADVGRPAEERRPYAYASRDRPPEDDRLDRGAFDPDHGSLDGDARFGGDLDRARTSPSRGGRVDDRPYASRERPRDGEGAGRGWPDRDRSPMSHDGRPGDRYVPDDSSGRLERPRVHHGGSGGGDLDRDDPRGGSTPYADRRPAPEHGSARVVDYPGFGAEPGSAERSPVVGPGRSERSHPAERRYGSEPDRDRRYDAELGHGERGVAEDPRREAERRVDADLIERVRPADDPAGGPDPVDQGRSVELPVDRSQVGPDPSFPRRVGGLRPVLFRR